MAAKVGNFKVTGRDKLDLSAGAEGGTRKIRRPTRSGLESPISAPGARRRGMRGRGKGGVSCAEALEVMPNKREHYRADDE